jgi:oxygen-independent coproporphyrinogen-3 oxidase
MQPSSYLPPLIVSGAAWTAAFLGFAGAYGPMLVARGSATVPDVGPPYPSDPMERTLRAPSLGATAGMEPAAAHPPRPVEEAPWTRYAGERLPRYTSYPTAAQFQAGVAADDYRAWIRALDPQTPVSLYLHIPFCASLCWYCGCHTTVTLRQAPVERYLQALHREIGAVAGETPGPLVVGHIHFGGGTPTIVGPDAFGELVRALAARFRIEPGAEIAVETDPRALTAEMAEALGKAGVTRASIGVQTFDPAVQAAINRIQSFAETEAAAHALRRAGVGAINLDVLYGLPGQTVRSCRETIERCLELRPDRFAVFGYAHVVAFKKHQRLIDAAQLPDGRARHEQAVAIGEALLAAGYARVGFDHFALPTDRLARAAAEGMLRRNFQGYTTDACDTLLGFGASAIGRLPQGYVQNEVPVGTYCERIGRDGLATAKGYRLTADDRLRAEVIERLMCDLDVDVAEVCARHGASPSLFAEALPRLTQLAEDGIVAIDGTRIRVPEASRLLVRLVAAAFDAHIAPAGRAFSRAV